MPRKPRAPSLPATSRSNEASRSHRALCGANSAHALAREATLAFLSGGKQSPNSYATALLQWEIFLGQSWHAYKLLQKGIRPARFIPMEHRIVLQKDAFELIPPPLREKLGVSK